MVTLLGKRKKTIIVICSVLVVIGLLLLAIWGISSAVVDNGYRTEDLFTEETQPYEKVDIVPKGKDREEVMSKINRLDYKNIEDVEKDSIENTFNFLSIEGSPYLRYMEQSSYEVFKIEKGYRIEIDLKNYGKLTVLCSGLNAAPVNFMRSVEFTEEEKAFYHSIGRCWEVPVKNGTYSIQFR